MEAVDDSAVGSTSHSDTIRAKIGIVDGADVPPFAPPLLLLLSVRADVRADIPSRVREEKKAAVFVGVGAESRCRGAGVVDGCGPTGISGPCADELDSGDGVRTGSDVDAFAPAGSSWGAKDDTGAVGAGVVEVLTCGTPLVPGVRRGSPEGVAVGVDSGVIGANVSVRSVLMPGVRRGGRRSFWSQAVGVRKRSGPAVTIPGQVVRAAVSDRLWQRVLFAACGFRETARNRESRSVGAPLR
ncbi:hypothetical protein GCM10020255_101560 [Rhodococcus baikonurensis]